MKSLLLALALVAWLPGRTAAASAMYLTGLVDIGPVRRAFVCVPPGHEVFTLQVGEETAGMTLLEVNFDADSARVWCGGEFVTVTFPCRDKEQNPFARFLTTGAYPADYTGPLPPGYEPEIIRRHRAGGLALLNSETNAPAGQAASAEYLGAVRKYARQLPADDRAAFQNELNRYSAGRIEANASDSSPAEPTHADRPASSEELSRRADAASLNTDDARLLQQILAMPPPEVGTETGTAEEVGQLRRLRRAQTDPAVRERILQQIRAYAAPAIWADEEF